MFCELSLIGTGTPLTAQFAQQSTVLAINDNVYVFDIGPRSNANFILNMSLEPSFVKAVFISHTHSDHIGDLGQLNLASWVRGREDTASSLWNRANTRIGGWI